MLGVIGNGAFSVGSGLFGKYLGDYEIRTILKMNQAILFLVHSLNFIFVMRWNLIVGIPDLPYVVCVDMLKEVVSVAFQFLPMMVLFAKITPKKIEATCFAFLGGTTNFCRSMTAPIVGATINDWFVGVTGDNLKDYYMLQLI